MGDVQHDIRPAIGGWSEWARGRFFRLMHSDDAGLPLLQKQVIEFRVQPEVPVRCHPASARCGDRWEQDFPIENGHSIPTPAWRSAAAREVIASRQGATSAAVGIESAKRSPSGSRAAEILANWRSDASARGWSGSSAVITIPR